MARKANRKSKSKGLQFREAKKKMQRVKLQEATRVPNKQYQRWPVGLSPLTPDLLETERDPDFVAFCVFSDLRADAKNEFGFLWLRIAASLRLGMYTVKEIDRTNRLRLFSQETFSESIADKDYEHEYGLRYEADKFLCYLLYGNNPRFRELFGYVLLPSIKNDLGMDLPTDPYNIWVRAEPTADLAKRLEVFDIDEVE